MSDIAKFTPGPWAARPDENSSCEWEVVKNDPRKTSISQDPWFICLCMDDADGASAKGNAHLIAAAPELYAACQYIVDAAENGDEMTAVEMATAALAKARGEA